MKNRTFYATFLLFLLAIYSTIFVLSVILLRDTAQQARERCLNEHYLIAAALYNDMAALESRDARTEYQLEQLIQPYLYLISNRGSTLAIYRDKTLLHTTGRLSDSGGPAQNTNEARTVSLIRDGERYLCSASGALPEPFDDYQILYQTDVTGPLGGWKHRTAVMLLAGSLLSLILALFLLLLLGRLFRPLSQITRLSGQLAAGDYTARLPQSGKDEIAQMARSFNHMADEIQTKIAELTAAAESQRQFVDSFTHELRTPLTAIYGYAEYMQKAALSEEDARFALGAILSESKRMLTMANQLLELSGLRQGEIKLKPLDLPALLDAVKHSVSPKLSEKNMALQISCKIGSITGDTILLQSLLTNLIDNAVKASDPGGTISVDASYQDGRPAISVSDRGRGMDPAELEKITQPYYRVDKSRNHKDGGAGIGLAICQQIALRHAAELSFQSAPGRGTTATVIFTA